MKLITHFLILFLIISITSENLIDDFSITLFINDLKSNGLFEIILSIKKVYGQDVAIISCEELNKNRKGACKKIVTQYMDPEISHDHKSIYNPNEKELYDKDSIKVGYLNSDQKLEMPFLDFILSKKFNSEQLKLISNKIKEKIKAKKFLLFYN